jgi:DNA replication ATP-dependent helicase Dna2
LVVATTAHSISSGSYDKALQAGGEFDLVIVDEATQLTEPLALGALRLGKKFLLVGDHRQLSPIVQSTNDKLSVSLFERLWGIPAAQESKVMLRTQYRMHPDIAEFASTEWYEGELTSDPSTSARTLRAAGASEISVVWRNPANAYFVDTAGSGNSLEEQLDLAIRFINEARTLEVRGEDIGVIAAYRNQVASLHRRLEQSGSAAGVTIDTADRYQGAERDVMIVVLSPEGRDRLLWDERRLNVSLTRSRKKLIVIGDSSGLSQIPVLDRYIQYHRKRGTLISREELELKREPTAALPI